MSLEINHQDRPAKDRSDDKDQQVTHLTSGIDDEVQDRSQNMCPDSINLSPYVDYADLTIMPHATCVWHRSLPCP
jgi:hypothetical protein